MKFQDIRIKSKVKIGEDAATADSKKMAHNQKAAYLEENGLMNEPQEKELENPKCTKCDSELEKLEQTESLYQCTNENCCITWEYVGTSARPIWICLFDPNDVEVFRGE